MPKISTQKLRAVQHIVTHENCPDGIASAMILHDVFPNAKLTFAQYGSKEQLELPAEPGMLFCDFSPALDRAREFLDAGAIVLDHHKTAKPIVDLFVEAGLGSFGDEVADPGVCGAVLAMRDVWFEITSANNAALAEAESPNAPYPPGVNRDIRHIKPFAELAGVRDTWQKNDPRWVEACQQAEALRFWPIEKLLSTPPEKWAALMEIGPILYERGLSYAKKCAEGAFWFTTQKGRKVAVFEGLKPSSDAAELLGASADLVIGYSVQLDDSKAPVMIFSTRSKGDFNCSALAQAYGGGGHTKAAGFRRFLAPLAHQPFQFARETLIEFERVEDQWVQVLADRSKDPDFRPADAFQKVLQEPCNDLFSSILD